MPTRFIPRAVAIDVMIKYTNFSNGLILESFFLIREGRERLIGGRGVSGTFLRFDRKSMKQALPQG